MRKRKRKNSNNDIQQIRLLFQRWKNGEDVSEELEKILEQHPEWLHNPPHDIGKIASIEWKDLTGHSRVYRDKHGICGDCECGYYPPKKE